MSYSRTDARSASRENGAPTSVYVTNLSASATMAAVRQLFDRAGSVLKVELGVERRTGNAPRSACVVMASPQEADLAIRQYDGRLFHDRNVYLSLTSEGYEGVPQPKPTAKPVSVTQQYRERQGMAYELDCAGARLTLRFAFSDDAGGPRRVEAMTDGGELDIVHASGTTRELALAALAETWRLLPRDPAVPPIDWAEVTAALRSVRAI